MGLVKVNLLINDDSVRSGFVNIDPFAEPGTNKTIGNIANLDDLVDDAEADELIALDIIDFLPSTSLEATLANWIGKVRHGGSITVGGVDMVAVAKALTKQAINLTDANTLLYGSQSEPWQYRKSTLTMQIVLTIFEKNNFKIIQKRLNNYRYLVKAERP